MGDTSERVWAAVGAILPPSDQEDPVAVRRWRVILGVVTLMNTISLAGHILLACGYLTMLHPGFASAGEVREMRREQMTQRVAELEKSILDTKMKQCMSPSGTVRSLYTSTLQKLRVDYQRITKEVDGYERQYPVPECNEF